MISIDAFAYCVRLKCKSVILHNELKSQALEAGINPIALSDTCVKDTCTCFNNFGRSNNLCKLFLKI